LEVDDTLKRVLVEFLDYAATFSDVKFVAVEQLFQR